MGTFGDNVAYMDELVRVGIVGEFVQKSMKGFVCSMDVTDYDDAPMAIVYLMVSGVIAR